MYATGTGVAQNEHLAIKWYTASADQGHDLAKRNLEIMMRTQEPPDDTDE